MKIFVSSLIGGYESLRLAARDAITSLGHEAVMAEDFRAQSNSPQVACLQGLRSAELVVLILVDRYGATQPTSGLSPTHEEYREARDAKPILLFVQEGVEVEPKQADFLKEAQGWQGGLFREGFGSAEQLRALITRAIHQYELSHATAPVDGRALAHEAESMLAGLDGDRTHGQEGPRLHVALVAGPARQLLRPVELEDESLADAMQQRATFEAPRLFERELGTERNIEGDALVLLQPRGASVSIDERGSMHLVLPLERRAGRHHGRWDATFAIIEESVVRELGSAIAFAAWLLDRVDATQRVTHVALAATIEAADHLGWRTQAEQDASPNAGSMRMFAAPSRPAVLDRPRAALKFDAPRLAEDLMVPLRRQRKG